MKRPEQISKLAIYLQDKEPLIYLFILNADFIYDGDGKYLPKEVALAGVTYKNRRVMFYYGDAFLKLSPKELFFVVLHEAFHIFKKHVDRHIDLYQEHRVLANVSEDSIINEEILKLVNTGSFDSSMKPCMPEKFLNLIPNEFKKEYESFGEHAYTTRRLFDWFKRRNDVKKSDLLQRGSYVKCKDGNYGKVSKNNGNGTYEVGTMSMDKMLKDVTDNMTGTQKDSEFEENFNSKEKYREDELTPIVFGDYFQSCQGEDGIEVEVINKETIDAHLEEENGGTEKEKELFAKKLFEQAKELEKVIQNKTAGNRQGGLMKSIEEIMNSKTNWKKILHRHINVFLSNDSNLKHKEKSFITYPWNPKSRYGILCKHFIEKSDNKQSYFIVATDTSGSVFFDSYETAVFFGEIEAISKWLDFSKKGRILTIQWDTEVAEQLSRYESKDWKKFEKKGGGGTNPKCIFEYMNNVFQKVGNRYMVNENGIKFTAFDRLPFLIILTDGYFFEPLTIDDLGIYSNHISDVLFFTRISDSIKIKGAQQIIYE